jgi:hypothetical protein
MKDFKDENFSAEFNAKGDIIKKTYRNGREITFIYEDDFTIEREFDPSNNLTIERKIDSRGNMIEVKYSNGYWERCKYDEKDNIIYREFDNGFSKTYIRDSNGELIDVVENQKG